MSKKYSIYRILSDFLKFKRLITLNSFQERNKTQLRELIDKERPFAIVIGAKNRRTEQLERMVREMVSHIQDNSADKYRHGFFY